jgi:hypothetical protein
MCKKCKNMSKVVFLLFYARDFSSSYTVTSMDNRQVFYRGQCHEISDLSFTAVIIIQPVGLWALFPSSSIFFVLVFSKTIANFEKGGRV